eukprot:CAMPEP_0114515532 /NCGR_PEP_ID=MMETSP0109-20121206/16796_1 /TAXON_ID=29199 /ORGANISM="Chlorarachnion reptans, Strain CCCM449" /LENGTH=61 /DNA_ID=CAMNT_0001695763 /DNA_START=648 /DNA_END=833 /DNA_ORIENTATION=+
MEVWVLKYLSVILEVGQVPPLLSEGLVPDEAELHSLWRSFLTPPDDTIDHRPIVCTVANQG